MQNQKLQRVINFLKWFLLWTANSPLWAAYRRKAGMKWKWIIPLMLLSPITIVLFWIPIYIYILVIYFCFISTSHCDIPVEDIKYNTPEEICAITEMTEFPEFKFISSDYDTITLMTISRFNFIDSLTVEQQEVFKAKCNEKDNAYWEQLDSVTWIFERGWILEQDPLGTITSDSPARPKGSLEPHGSILIFIQKDGFIIFQGKVNSSPLYLTELPTITIPPHDIVSDAFWLREDDCTHNIVIKLKHVPSTDFYNDWTYDATKDTYTNEFSEGISKKWELTTKRGSRIVRISYTES